MDALETFQSLFTPTPGATASLLFAKYAVVLFTVFLTAGITFWFIKRIADFIIAIALVGSAWFVCQAIHDGHITSWAEAIGSAVGVGAIASILCIPVLPLSSALDKAKSKESQLSPQSKRSVQPGPIEESLDLGTR